MANKRRHTNRRRKSRLGFFYKFLSILAICAAIVAAMTLFFRVDQIVITGEERYTEAEIQEASGVHLRDNLFLLNKSKIVKRITKKLPYVRSIRVVPKAPDTLTLEVRECLTPLAVVQDGSAWIVDPGGTPNGRILDQKPASAAKELGIIDGCDVLAPSVGTYLSLAAEFEPREEGLSHLMAALEEEDMVDQVDAIHLEDPSTLLLDYGGRFTVQLRYNADFSLKMKGLKAILESGKIPEDVHGTFDMRREDGKANFIPNRK